MNLVPTESIRRMDALHRITIPEYICATLNYEADAPFEFYVDAHEKVVVIRPYDPNDEMLDCKNNHNAKVWLESQIEAFSMFGYDLNFLFSNGQPVFLDFPAPISTKKDMETAFTLWEKSRTSLFYKEDRNKSWWLYPIVDKEKAILWIAYTQSSYPNDRPICTLADTYLEKFVR